MRSLIIETIAFDTVILSYQIHFRNIIYLILAHLIFSGELIAAAHELGVSIYIETKLKSTYDITLFC